MKPKRAREGTQLPDGRGIVWRWGRVRRACPLMLQSLEGRKAHHPRVEYSTDPDWRFTGHLAQHKLNQSPRPPSLREARASSSKQGYQGGGESKFRSAGGLPVNHTERGGRERHGGHCTGSVGFRARRYQCQHGTSHHWYLTLPPRHPLPQGSQGRLCAAKAGTLAKPGRKTLGGLHVSAGGPGSLRHYGSGSPAQ